MLQSFILAKNSIVSLLHIVRIDLVEVQLIKMVHDDGDDIGLSCVQRVAEQPRDKEGRGS